MHHDPAPINSDHSQHGHPERNPFVIVVPCSPRQRVSVPSGWTCTPIGHHWQNKSCEIGVLCHDPSLHEVTMVTGPCPIPDELQAAGWRCELDYADSSIWVRNITQLTSSHVAA